MSDRCPTCGARAVVWTPAKLIHACQQWAEEYGAPPTVKDWKYGTPTHPAHNCVYKQFGSWGAMIRAAGLTPRRVGGSRTWTREAATLTLTPWVFEHGRLPKRKEWRSPADGRPTTQQVTLLFGSWNAFVVACGYEPAKRYRTSEGYQRQASGVRMRELNEAA